MFGGKKYVKKKKDLIKALRVENLKNVTLPTKIKDLHNQCKCLKI